MSFFFAPLIREHFGVIHIDPPWPYDMRSEAGYAKSPESYYDTMPVDRIAALPVGELAGPNCLLVMWSTWPHLAYAMEIMRVWGFAYKTGGAWHKKTRHGKSGFGTGFILRSATEPYLVGTIGNPRIVSKSVRNVIETVEYVDDIEDFPSVIEATLREYSRKPAEMRDMLERLCPWARKVDVFAREPWAGQTVWGKEAHLFGGA
ncbi:MT-A70 family methyltransferase [Labrys neptuniae]|uniref:MT-A70 family methyltransferase n=1 Tax=Labrys neptuniae TaxID=376174 RepID=A0ABV3PGH4_9HYPH